jgi:stress-induced-phosphoprotein 1
MNATTYSPDFCILSSPLSLIITIINKQTYIHTACYKQVSNYDGTISDCSAVLEVDPQNVKALIRRAQAFEGVERYRFALQDVKTVHAMPYHLVGKQNFDLCNGMQHRLQRTVNQLKQMN